MTAEAARARLGAPHPSRLSIGFMLRHLPRGCGSLVNSCWLSSTRTSSLSRWISLVGFLWRALRKRVGTLLLVVHRPGPGWWMPVGVAGHFKANIMFQFLPVKCGLCVPLGVCRCVCWHEVARCLKGQASRKGKASQTSTLVGHLCCALLSWSLLAHPCLGCFGFLFGRVPNVSVCPSASTDHPMRMKSR